METREGMIKCEGCQKAFDVDLLQYEDDQEKFGCPECGSTKFRPLLEEEDIPVIESAHQGKRPPDLAEVLREMTQLMREAHDQHIYGPDDEHDEDCRYCAMIGKAEEALKKF